MSLHTRLDGRSPTNNSIQIVDESGNVAGVLTILSKKTVEVEIATASHLSVLKVNGYSSKDKE
jgi:hypothetical protein